jgi:hypothetical protein
MAAIDSEAVKNTCVNEGPAVFSLSVPSVLTDLLTTLLPNLLLLDLTLPASQKWKLAILFGAGYIVTAVGAVRIYWTYQYLFVSWDGTWTGYSLLVWSNLEATFAVLCSCVPALNALYTKWAGPKSRELVSSVKTKRSRASKSVGYAEMDGKVLFSGTSTTQATIAAGEPPVMKPLANGQKDIEMARVSVYTIGEAL